MQKITIELLERIRNGTVNVRTSDALADEVLVKSMPNIHVSLIRDKIDVSQKYGCAIEMLSFSDKKLKKKGLDVDDSDAIITHITAAINKYKSRFLSLCDIVLYQEKGMSGNRIHFHGYMHSVDHQNKTKFIHWWRRNYGFADYDIIHDSASWFLYCSKQGNPPMIF